MRVGITGASGLIGSALTGHLERGGHEVVAFVRRPAKAGEIEWDPGRGRLDPAALAGLDAVVHLAGAGIGDHRWTEKYKAEVLDSRVLGTTLISQAIVDSGVPKVLLSASAIGYYGSSESVVDERSPAGDDFAARVAVAWEASTAVAEEASVRVAHLRTGIVLSGSGGALKRMLPLFKLGLGGRFGDGRQWMSWISIVDEVRAIEHLLTSSVSGAVNLTAPNPSPNSEFAATLGRVLGRPVWLPVPKFGPKLLLGGELVESLLFSSQRVDPSVLVTDGFEFEHPQLEAAFRAVLGA